MSSGKSIPSKVTVKSKNDEDEDDEIQKGWCGHILPFELVQKYILTDDYNHLLQTRNLLTDCQQETSAMIDELSEDDRENYLNDANDAFDMNKVFETINKALSDVNSPEIQGLTDYLELLSTKPKKAVKIEFIKAHTEVGWNSIAASKMAPMAKEMYRSASHSCVPTTSSPMTALRLCSLRSAILQQERKTSSTTYQSRRQHCTKRHIRRFRIFLTKKFTTC